MTGKTQHRPLGIFTRTKTLTNVGVQNGSPQDAPLWYADNFELRVTETLWVREKLSSVSYRV